MAMGITWSFLSMDMSNFLKKFSMRKRCKNINIALIFMLIEVFLSLNFAYPSDISHLRVPMGDYERGESKQLCEQIYNIFTSRKYRSGSKPSTEVYKKILVKLDSMIANNLPIEILQFWGGSKNPHLPIAEADIAEEATLDNLYELSCEVKKIYPPGLKINILLGDGRVQEVNGISQEKTQRYTQSLRELVINKGYSYLFNIVQVSSYYQEYDKEFRERLESARKRVYSDIEKMPYFSTLVENATRNILDEDLTPSQIEQRSIAAAKEYVVYRVAEEEARIFREFDHCIRGFFIKYAPYYRKYIGTTEESEFAQDAYFVFYTGGKGNRIQPWQAIGVKDTSGKSQFLTQKRLLNMADQQSALLKSI